MDQSIKDLFEKAKKEYPEHSGWGVEKFDRYFIAESPTGEIWMYGSIYSDGESDEELPLFKV